MELMKIVDWEVQRRVLGNRVWSRVCIKQRTQMEFIVGSVLLIWTLMKRLKQEVIIIILFNMFYRFNWKK